MDSEQIWPDGDSPPEPSAEDVIKAMKETDDFNPLRVFEDWNLGDRASVVVMKLSDRKDKAWW